jgi:hypothetical protein
MFLLVTVLGAVVGLWSESARRQRLAIEALERLGATVYYDSSLKDVKAPAWLKGRLGEDFFLSVDRVIVANYGSFDDHIEPKPAISPEKLDQIVAAVVSLGSIGQLTFSWAGFHDDDLARLLPLDGRLESLRLNERTDLSPGRMKGAGLRHLAGWRGLTEVVLNIDQLDREALAHLKQLPDLKRLVLHDNQRPLDAALLDTLARLPRLETLELTSCIVDGRLLGRLRKSGSLKTVGLLGMVLSEVVDEDGDRFYLIGPGWRSHQISYGPDRQATEAAQLRGDEWLKTAVPGLTIKQLGP